MTQFDNYIYSQVESGQIFGLEDLIYNFVHQDESKQIQNRFKNLGTRKFSVLTITNCETLLLKIADFQKMTNEFHRAAELLQERQTGSLIKVLEERMIANDDLNKRQLEEKSGDGSPLSSRLLNNRKQNTLQNRIREALRKKLEREYSIDKLTRKYLKIQIQQRKACLTESRRQEPEKLDVV